MATSNMQSGQAMQLFAPDLAQEQTQLSRRQQLADMLRKQSFESSGPTEMVSGWAVKKSPYEGLVKMAQALAANYVQDKTDTRQLEIAKEADGRMGAAFGEGNTSPSIAASAAQTMGASQQPSTPDATGEMVNQGGVGPTNANAARMGNILAQGAGTAPQGGGLTIPGMTPKQAKLAFMLDQNAYMGSYLKQFDPTERQRNDRYMGITSPESRAAYDAENRVKGTQTLAPNTTGILPNGSKVVGADFANGIQPGYDANGNATVSAIANSAEIAAQRASMIKGAEANATAGVTDRFAVPAPVDAATGRVAMTPAQQRMAASGGRGDPAYPNAAPSAGITNPGNMRPPGASTGFAKFATAEEGMAAVDKNLQSYGKQGVNTISGIISKWAPPSENNTPAYISAVSQRLGVKADQPLDMNNPIVRQALSTAITLHEHGPSKVFAPPTSAGIPLKSAEQTLRDEAKVKLETQPGIDRNVQTAKDMAEYEKNLNGHLSESQALLQRIGQSREALTKFNAGGGGEMRGKLASLAQAIPGMPRGVVDGLAGGDLSALQEFQKYAAQEALGTMQQALASDTGKSAQGNRIAMQLFIKNNPNVDTDPRAIEKIFNFQTNLHNRLLDQSNAYQDYKKDPNNDVSAFPNRWANDEIKRGAVNPEIKTGYAKGNVQAVPANVKSLLDKYK